MSLRCRLAAVATPARSGLMDTSGAASAGPSLTEPGSSSSGARDTSGATSSVQPSSSLPDPVDEVPMLKKLPCLAPSMMSLSTASGTSSVNPFPEPPLAPLPSLPEQTVQSSVNTLPEPSLPSPPPQTRPTSQRPLPSQGPSPCMFNWCTLACMHDHMSSIHDMSWTKTQMKQRLNLLGLLETLACTRLYLLCCLHGSGTAVVRLGCPSEWHQCFAGCTLHASASEEDKEFRAG